ncbi:MAG: S1/P1 nuclease [Candidatus Marinimicrobia bacterium]|nr:S1/P1 nuclease [Candidatus Neomarinimicrobiota bacterium]MBT3630745.1 S1/P1 nuclease [Candidatus Neomarinimicrobiota bacterium]MBT3823882.1 S1/P1 nuclease [Candidatus Neomarinimicrobiota bacterium]MBT4130299.1 S1/P1 nuclease [Candidatus Neomarinimicrobiota bacterium]MBT4295132.1 S1/P1 nuclease [Candidatus Neomarinimicrobiota bacterium]
MRQLIIILVTATILLGWGKTGHRVIGKIAEENLTPEAQAKITELFGHSDLARIGNWADEIKSDPKWDHSHDWHYCTIIEGQDYAGPETGGRAVQKVTEFSNLLRKGTLGEKDQKDVLRFIVHIVGDLHQPLHVGNGTDRGGNDVKVTWFREETNLHRVWDSQMVDHMQYSYTEFAQQIQLGMSDEDKAALLDPTLLSFVNASRATHPQVYDIDDGKLSWPYIYKNRELMEDRLLNGGFHLAAILNDIYK